MSKLNSKEGTRRVYTLLPREYLPLLMPFLSTPCEPNIYHVSCLRGDAGDLGELQDIWRKCIDEAQEEQTKVGLESLNGKSIEKAEEAKEGGESGLVG